MQQTPRDPSSFTAQPLRRCWVTSTRHPPLAEEQTYGGKESKSLPTADPSEQTQLPEKQAGLEAGRRLDGALPFWMVLQVLLLYRARRVPALTSRPHGGMTKPSVSPRPRVAGVQRAGAAR